MIIGLVSIVVWIAIEDDKDFYSRYHQHQKQNSEVNTSLDFSDMKTHLPTIMIETEGQRIPGTPIYNNEDYYYQLSEQGESEIETAFTLYQGEMEPLSLTTMVHYRGHSSRFFEKKSYALRFMDEDNNDKDVSLLGMEADNNWALNGPFLDRSLIRNYVGMNVSGEIMPFAPDVRFVEVFVNGSYEGLYLLMEKVSKGEGRVPLATPDKGSQLTDYLVQVDRTAKMDIILNDFLMDTYKGYPSGVELIYPANNQDTEELQQFVNKDFSFIAHSIYQIPYAHEENQYRKLLNVQAFYDYFIINELFRNVDAGKYSTYFYRDLKGGLTPVVWDFNNSLDNYQVTAFDESGFSLTQAIFYEQLLKDEAFVDGLIKRYYKLRETKLSTERLHSYVDETLSFLGDAVVRNNNRWGYVYDLNQYNTDDYLQPIDRNYTSYEDSTQQVKDYLEKRGEWLDHHIYSLRQYSHLSRHSHESIK